MAPAHTPTPPRAGEEQSCPDPEAFKAAMEHTFEEIKRTDTEPGGWDATSFKNSADALASVLELVRIHKVRDGVCQCVCFGEGECWMGLGHSC